jgi:ABC-type bacteriocin/lantibiotic exporter with double-glycine peptidase domain
MNVDDVVRVLYPPGTVERPKQATSPYRRLRQMIFEDKSDLILILIYTFFSGLFSLSIPLATQIVVNTVAAGVFLQPLTVIAGGVLGALFFVAALRLLTLWIVEQIRQRTFARIALRLAYRVPRIKHTALANEYLPELVNRFFDTITVQSGWFNFLLTAPAAALQVIVGLVLLAFYSPWLLLFDIIVVLFFLLEVYVFGYGGFRTRSDETTQRFLIAEWLEEIARCEAGIKTNGIPSYLLKTTDKLLVDYVKLRRKQFSVLFRQNASLFFFQALSSAGVLGFGGYLVIHRELTMGQLVASLLIVNMVLPGLERVVQNMQNIYELLSALGKIGYIEDLPLERKGGETLPRSSQGARVDIRGLRFSYKEGTEVLHGLDLSLQPGERISLFGPNGSGKTTLAEILCGLLEPAGGLVQINGIDVRDVDLSSLRKVVSLMSDANEIFPGTVIENVTLGRSDVTHLDALWALDLVKFNEELKYLPNGLQTELSSGGRNLSRGQVQKLLLARAIVKRPQLLILDEAFTAIEEKTKLEILDQIYSSDLSWTIVDISHDADSILRSHRIVVLSQGRIAESGSPEELINRVDGRLEQLFPQLVQILRITRHHDSSRPR